MAKLKPREGVFDYHRACSRRLRRQLRSREFNHQSTMNQFIQYLKDTRGELRHVAWPTQSQTILYTLMVTLISIGVSLYLGLFDFLFTTGLTRIVEVLPAQQKPALEISTSTPVAPTLSTSTIPVN